MMREVLLVDRGKRKSAAEVLYLYGGFVLTLNYRLSPRPTKRPELVVLMLSLVLRSDRPRR